LELLDPTKRRQTEDRETLGEVKR